MCRRISKYGLLSPGFRTREARAWLGTLRQTWVCDHGYLSDTIVLTKREKEKKQNLVDQGGSNEKKSIVMPTKAFLI